MDLTNIKDPSFLKDLSIEQLEKLAEEIKTFLYESISKTGGHLSSNLGIVELSIALHYVFDSPNDKLIFDVGHQGYVHKILTGRAKEFHTLRQINGIAGFLKQKESIHDIWEAGHSSTSISAAIGLAIARDLDNQDFHIVSIIGDGALTNGMSLEALNHLSKEKKKVIIILNDNSKNSIQTIKSVDKSFNKLRSSKPYNAIKKEVSSTLEKNKFGELILDSLKGVKNVVKRNVVNENIFTNFNIDYLGPIDGHNIKELINVLNYAKNHQGPVVIHTITKNDSNIELLENDPLSNFNEVGPFDLNSKEALSKLENNHYTWSEIIVRHLINLAKNDKDIVAITPSMLNGSKLNVFKKYFPERIFDTGNAESHATTLAAGLAVGNKKPFLSLYSTYLQRSYDQINHDIARVNLPVVIGINQAGIVGDYGDTHQGVFDISLLNSLPNMTIVQGSDPIEAGHLLYSSLKYNGPTAIRYPRGSEKFEDIDKYEFIEKGSWTKAYWPEKIEAIIITYGSDVIKLKSKIIANKLNYAIINARFIKPLDTEMLNEIVQENKLIFTYENEMLNGGLSSSINNYYQDNNIVAKLVRFGIDDVYIQHGSISSLRKHYNLDHNYILNTIRDVINKE